MADASRHGAVAASVFAAGGALDTAGALLPTPTTPTGASKRGGAMGAFGSNLGTAAFEFGAELGKREASQVLAAAR